MESPDVTAGMPVVMAGETLVLCRSAHLSVDIDGVIKQGLGTVFISNLRLVFIAEQLAVDLPLATLEDEQFHQPIFGANSLTGKSPPLPGSNIANVVRWKFTFNQGVGTFLSIFYILLAHMRTNSPAMFQDVLSSRLAYVDPNDPSRLFVAVS